MSSSEFRGDIQGLRALAVLIVIAFHYNPAWMPGGFVGVDVFLVISGFLITGILMNKKEKANYTLRNTLKYFYVSRFKRIAPAYFFMLAIVALFSAVLFLPKDFAVFKDGLRTAAWFASNAYFADFGDYFAPATHEQPLLHTWSLAVEIQFYLLAPFAILLLHLRWLKWFFSVALVGLIAVAEYRLRYAGVEQATYYSLYARLPEFIAGGLVAIFMKCSPGRAEGPSWIGGVGLMLILVAAIAQPLLGPFPGLAVLLPVTGTIILLAKGATEGWIGRLLNSRVMIWIGALSYSLYLWHWPVLALMRYYTGAEVLSPGFSVLFIVLTLALSMVSYYLVEQGFRAKRTAKKRALGWTVLIAAVVGVSQAVAKVNTTFTPEQLRIEYLRGVDPEISCHGKIVGDCLRGSLSTDREVLVLGDSHGNQLNLFFDYIGSKLDFRARVITGSSCVTIPGFDYQRLPEWAQRACIEQIEKGQSHQQNVEAIFLVGKWTYHTQSDAFITAIEHYLKNMEIINKPVVILSQIPQFTQSAMRARRFDKIGLKSYMVLDPGYSSANLQLEAIAKKYSNVTYMALDSLPVFEDAPFWEGEIIYRDKHHINELGAKIYAEDALPHFQNVLNNQKY